MRLMILFTALLIEFLNVGSCFAAGSPVLALKSGGSTETLQAKTDAYLKASSLSVTATAYNALASQGEGDPTMTACGKRLRGNEAVIAVSDDLFKDGFGCGTSVYIEELKQRFVVQDRMNPRWNSKIDIFMGTDVARALQWGRRRVTLKRLPQDKVLQR